ncbi:MAG: D-alanyl-D-alanine carboxypeptidase family protein [Phormidesmis sp.]
MSTQILEDRFEIEKQLSHTDFSTVYLAYDRRYLHRPHCLVTAIAYQKPEIRHRLEREAQTLERLGRHPQIPTLLAYFHTADIFYMVTEQIVGHPLSTEISPNRPLSEGYVSKLLQDTLTALAAVHEQGVVHQNLQPQHLIRQDADGQIFITQFGSLIKLIQSNIASGPLGSTVSSSQPYAAPEQAQHLQPASDLYALGLIAIEALTGKPHQDFAYDPAKGLRWREQATVSLGLAEFIDRLVRHDWQDRFATAQAALETLRVERDRHQIANDSRLPTVIAAPGAKGVEATRTTEFGHSRFPSSSFVPTRAAAGGALANLPLLKLAIGSVALVLALGIGVKTYQWGTYRLSRLPQTWQDWRGADGENKPAPEAAYPKAKTADLTPLLADGSILLRPAAADAFWQMVVAAREDGIELYPLAGFSAETEQDYVTGYALDIGGAAAADDQQDSFARTAAFRWLRANAQSHGFERSVLATGLANRLLPGGLLGGAVTEPWHWRYVGDAQSQQVFGIEESQT